MTEVNGALAPGTPGLQKYWDSTSLGELKLCPQRYKYSILDGWRPRAQSVHLTFGIAFHQALEAYDRARALGQSHVEGQREALREALRATWDFELKRPWMSQDKYKNRENLVRSVIWYLENFSEDSIETVIMAGGKPAVELHFNIALEIETPVDGPYHLVGYLDKLGRMSGQTYIIDRKTTKHQLDSRYFQQWSPSNQFSTYIFAGQIVFGGPIAGLIVDAAQVLIEGTRFQRELVSRTPGEIEEWGRDLEFWLRQAEWFAREGHWPLNDKACDIFGGCPFREVCSKTPSAREQWLKAGFEKRIWDPTKLRGDI